MRLFQGQIAQNKRTPLIDQLKVRAFFMIIMHKSIVGSMLVCTVLAVAPFAPSIAFGAESAARVDSGMAKQRKLDDFKSAKRCLEAMTSLGKVQQELYICNSKVNGAGLASKNNCQAKTAELSGKAKLITEDSTVSACSRDPEVLSDKYNVAVKEAAEAGSIDAQMCYIQGGGGQGASPVDLSAYKALARGYLNQALDRGDWRAVELLSTSPTSMAHGGAGLLVNLPEVGNWETAYGATKLLSLGATDDFAKSLNSRLTEAAHWLSEERIRAAEQWAQDMYRKSFHNSPRLTADPVPCLGSYQ